MQYRLELNRGEPMKIRIPWLIAFFIFGCNVLYSQESVERSIAGIQGLTIEDGIRLIYTDSRKNKLRGIEILKASRSTDDAVIQALVSCLNEGTLYQKRNAGRIVNNFWYVRMKSAEALGNIGSTRALTDLHMALRIEPDPVVKSYIANAIGRIGQPESIPYLAHAIKIAGLSGSEDIVVKSCVEAIGEIGSKDGLWVLIDVIDGGYDKDIRLSAQNAIKKLQ